MIYYVINGRLPTEKANGYQISQMCQAFSENGEKVLLLRPNRTIPERHLEFKDDLKKFYNLHAYLSVKTIWSIDFQNLFHEIHRSFDRFQFVTNLMHTASYVLGLMFFFLSQGKNSEDVLYLRDINILSWLYPFLNRNIKENIVLELHYLPENKIKRMRYAKILRKARIIVAITHKMKEDLILLGIPAGKITAEHDGVDLQSFPGNLDQKKCRQEMGYATEELIVGYVGNFHTNGQEKGIDDLIRSAEIVLKKMPRTQFYFVGGPLDRVPKYLQLIHDLKLPLGNFHFQDRVPVSKVPIVMGACDILTIPLPWNPYFAFYMSPMKLFEYMASKRCIVATDVESLKEVLTDGETAFLAKHSDFKELAKKIIMAAEDPALRKIIAENAFKEVQKYTWGLRALRIKQFLLR